MQTPGRPTRQCRLRPREALPLPGGEPGGAPLLSWPRPALRVATAPGPWCAREAWRRFRPWATAGAPPLGLARAAVLSGMEGDLAGAERAWQESRCWRGSGPPGYGRRAGHLAVLRLRGATPCGAVTLFERSVTLSGPSASGAPPPRPWPPAGPPLAGRGGGGRGFLRAWALLRRPCGYGGAGRRSPAWPAGCTSRPALTAA